MMREAKHSSHIGAPQPEVRAHQTTKNCDAKYIFGSVSCKSIPQRIASEQFYEMAVRG